MFAEKQKDFRLYKSIFPADLKHTTLAFIGLLVPLGPTWPINELQARWASGVIAGHLKLPPMKDMQEEVSKVDQDTVMKWKRDTVYIFNIVFLGGADNSNSSSNPDTSTKLG